MIDVHLYIYIFFLNSFTISTRCALYRFNVFFLIILKHYETIITLMIRLDNTVAIVFQKNHRFALARPWQVLATLDVNLFLDIREREREKEIYRK